MFSLVKSTCYRVSVAFFKGYCEFFGLEFFQAQYLPDFAEEGQAVHFRHLDVEYNELQMFQQLFFGVVAFLQ